MSDELRLRVATEAGLPAELADRLKGDTEETLRVDAQALSQVIQPASAGSFDAGARRDHTPRTLTDPEAIRDLAGRDPHKFNQMVEAGQINLSALSA